MLRDELNIAFQDEQGVNMGRPNQPQMILQPFFYICMLFGTARFIGKLSGPINFITAKNGSGVSWQPRDVGFHRVERQAALAWRVACPNKIGQSKEEPADPTNIVTFYNQCGK